MIDYPTGTEDKNHRANAGADSTKSGDRRNCLVGKEITWQRLHVIDPNLKTKQHHSDQSQRHHCILRESCKDPRGHQERSKRDDYLARAVDAPSARDQVSRYPTARQTAGVGGDVWHPREQSNLRQRETASIRKILRQPTDVEPPNGIG